MAAPNILLIMADQLAPQFLPAYGHPIVQAPHLSGLAAEGVTFDNAYSNSPLCSPARAMMMTGRFGSRTGVYDNAAEWPSSVPTFAHALREDGYRTSLAGKMHFIGADQLHGFEDRSTTDIYPADFGWTPDWEHSEHRFDWWFHNMDSVLNAGVAESSNQLDYDDEVGFHALRTLRDLGREPDERPWLLTVSFTHPHDPYVMRQEYWDRYDHDEIDAPAVPALPVDRLDPHSARLRRVSDMDEAGVTADHVRNARHAYYAAISYIDDWVGRILETLETYGMADDTVVIFTSDHGDMLGERGLWYKMTFFEHAARVPLIVRDPHRMGPRRVAEPVSLLDLAPTVTDMAGAPPMPALDGVSLVPLLDGDVQPERTVYGEYLGEGAEAPLLMVRRGCHKYVWCTSDPPQLYDLSADPHELHNLAGTVAVTEVEAEMERLVAERWDPATIHGEVLDSQRRRRRVDAALRRGRFQPWDYDPPARGAERFMRNHLDLNELEARRRYPPV